MEVHLEVFAERIPDIPRFKSNSAFFTFVALDGSKRPVPAPEVVPSTEHEKELFEGALRRRELRLVLAGKMKPQDSAALKALFGENN